MSSKSSRQTARGNAASSPASPAAQSRPKSKANSAPAKAANQAEKGAAAGKRGAKTGGKGRTISNVCVYCGSGHGTDPRYAQAARTLGESLAEAGIGLVYGGGGLGLMGEVARATLGAGGRVTGIIPEFLTRKEHMLREVDKLLITADMHERKRLMFEHSDAFVALPGGIGTLEELVEQLTWSQLGQHKKSIVVANIAGFWDPFLKLLAHMRDDEFIRNGINVRFIVVDQAEAIVPAILAHAAAETEEISDSSITAKF